MKKIVGIIAAAALATSAFAEVNVSSWNRAVFEPFHYDGDTLRSFEGASWGVGNGNRVRSGLSFSGSTENAGIAIDIHAEGPSTGDNAYVWVKPVDMLTVKFGKLDNSYGRLDHCFGTWDLSRFRDDVPVSVGEGLAGVDRAHRGETGADFVLTPVEGLVIDYQANFKDNSTNHTYDVMWESSSTMIGYKADFGFIRAIVNGAQADKYSVEDTDTKPAAVIGLAADITAVENLTLKFGASIPTLLKKSTSAIKIGAGADYTLDALTLHAQTELAIRAKKITKVVGDNVDCDLGAFTAYVGAGVDYAFNDAWKLITDVRFNTYTKQNTEIDGSDVNYKYEDPAFGAYIGLRQQLSNATFDFGAQFGKRALKNQAAGKADDFAFAVPLTITASF